MVPLMAFFFCGRFSVIVTIPDSDRVTSIVSMPSDDTESMGFDPQRRRVPRRSDYVFVVAAVVVAVGLLAWAFLA